MDSSSFSKNKCTNKQSNQIKPSHSRQKSQSQAFSLTLHLLFSECLSSQLCTERIQKPHVVQTKLCVDQHPPQPLFSKFLRENAS